jgi:uncharacterized protein YjiS (DUF1127 family)
MPAQLPAGAGLLARWFVRLRANRRQRAMLELPDLVLRDIGLSRDDLRRTLSAPDDGR